MMIAFKSCVWLAMVGGILASPHPLLADGKGEDSSLAVSFHLVDGTEPSQDAESPAAPGYFVADCRLPLPDGTLLQLALRRAAEEKPIRVAYLTCALKDGGFKVKIGPIDKVKLGPSGDRPVLRGRYAVEVWLDMQTQPRFVIRDLRKKHGYSDQQRERLLLAEVQVGTEEQRLADDAEVSTAVRNFRERLQSLNDALGARIEAPSEAPAKPERKAWCNERLQEIQVIRKELPVWYGAWLGVPGEKHVELLDSMVIVASRMINGWYKDPEDEKLKEQLSRARRLYETFDSFPLPGESLRDLPQEDREGGG